MNSAMCDAGKAIIKISKQEFDVKQKRNLDPVTSADLEANRILKETLTTQFPEYGWLSEETRDNYKRLNMNRLWIVDPIDGTKEFIEQIPEFSISVALVEKGEPIMGGVYNPSTQEMFTAIKNEGSYLDNHIIKANHPLGQKPKILASRSEMKRGEFNSFEKIAEIKPMGSIAYKLALIAAGQADATFSLSPKNEWDIVAGILLVKEAQGYVSDKKWKSFTFNQKDTLVNSIVASTTQSFPIIKEQIMRSNNE
jgi:myo-inositol-1(or 4)-monophosphatase